MGKDLKGWEEKKRSVGVGFDQLGLGRTEDGTSVGWGKRRRVNTDGEGWDDWRWDGKR